MASEKRKKTGGNADKAGTGRAATFPCAAWTVLSLLWLMGLAIIWRAVDQQVYQTDFLKHEGDIRHLRVVEVPAHRGMIQDRRGEPLAVSAPVDSIWSIRG